MIRNIGPKAFAVMCALLLIGMALAPIGVAADTGVDSINLDLEQENGTVILSVTDGESGIENASVNISSDDEVDFDGIGNHTTDEDGEVRFDAPLENMTVNVTASYDNLSASQSYSIEGHAPGLEVWIIQEGEAGDVSIEVTDNETGVENAFVNVSTEDTVSYDGIGNHTTDENGVVDLSTPNETLTIDVIAEFDNQTASTSGTIYNTSDWQGGEDADADPFGLNVSTFVHSLLSQDNVTGIGPLVASYVVEHNPGNAPDHAGPPDHLFDDEGNWSPGPPEHAAAGNDSEREPGPPDHAGGPHADDDNERGPPGNAGGPN